MLQLERIYTAQQELLQAELSAFKTEAECNNTEANWLAQQCRLLRLEHAKYVVVECRSATVYSLKHVYLVVSRAQCGVRR